jgi:Ca2+-transporting ATPase
MGPNPEAREQASVPSHARSAADVAESLGSRLGGLDPNQAIALLAHHGTNELEEAPAVPAWKRFLLQFNEFVIWILIGAAVIAAATGAWADAIAVLVIVVLNGSLGFLQEARAEHALNALRSFSPLSSRVRRGGEVVEIPARDLVPGDRIELEAGDRVPADARLLEGFSLRVQEAILTGESVPVDKDHAVVLDEKVPLGDRRNMVFTGTILTAGSASAVVVSTGHDTELGRLALLMRAHPRELTPLQRKFQQLGKVLLGIVVCLSAVILLLELSRGAELGRVLLLTVSLAVAAVPEGLPAVVTLALAVGLRRLAKRNALIRRLPSVETLGSVTVICSDKTGTLTRNEMTVREVSVGDLRYSVSGVGYDPRGEFRTINATGREGDRADPRSDPDLLRALSIASGCNNAQLKPPAKGQGWHVIGDPTEGALVVAARKAGILAADARRCVVSQVPFDSERKAMSVLIRREGALDTIYTKGAVEVVLDLCVAEAAGGAVLSLTSDRRVQLLELAEEMSARALRVLALAYREGAQVVDGVPQERELVFAGLIGMLDPPRPEAMKAVETCRRAGIRTVMITGDHPDTALAIAKELGIAPAEATTEQCVLTGAELDAVADLRERVSQVSVFARVSAEHKLKLVRALQATGEIVAMTGDGVNDAPAIQVADIGIAMGRSGTDVTREAADMVLVDDNFASIVSAAEEGRAIYDNIQKVVNYLLSCNLAAVAFMLLASILGWPVPLLARQLLWINFVTDGLPALALIMEPPEGDLMNRRPRPPHEPIITWRLARRMAITGLLVTLVTAIAFHGVYDGSEASLGRARTCAFSVLAYSQLFFAFSCRSWTKTLPQLGLLSNPYLLLTILASAALQFSVVAVPLARPALGTSMLLPGEWLLVIGLALIPVSIVEVAKLALSRPQRFASPATGDRKVE